MTEEERRHAEWAKAGKPVYIPEPISTIRLTIRNVPVSLAQAMSLRADIKKASREKVILDALMKEFSLEHQAILHARHEVSEHAE